MPGQRIAIIGAASTEFGLPTLAGLFEEREALGDATISLVDADAEGLDAMAGFARSANARLGASFTIESTTDRREAQ